MECLCLGTFGLMVVPWGFDVLETGIFALEASLLGQICWFWEHRISAGQLSADGSSTETLYCLSSVQWLEVACIRATFPRFSNSLRKILNINGIV